MNEMENFESLTAVRERMLSIKPLKKFKTKGGKLFNWLDFRKGKGGVLSTLRDGA